MYGFVPLLCAVLLTALPTVGQAQENLDAEVKNMTWVGFQLLADASRVFVRTTDPVKYTVDASRPHVVIITLDNTRIPVLNNTRALDTQYFESPVTRVEIKPIEAPSPSVRIEIHTRPIRAKYKDVQKDTELSLDFAKE